MYINFCIIFFLLLANAGATANLEFDLLPKEPTFCSIDKKKENQNDPCSPESSNEESGQPISGGKVDNVPVRALAPAAKKGSESKAPKAQPPAIGHNVKNNKIQVLFFWGVGCPHCAQEKPFLESLKGRYPKLDIVSLEVLQNKENAALFQRIASIYGVNASGVPATFIGNRALIGFSDAIAKDIERAIAECMRSACVNPLDKQTVNGIAVDRPKELQPDSEFITIPFIGPTDVSKMTLPMMTVVIAGLDSFNPCAFFVLFSLLGLMIHARSRTKMALIGGIFVFCSGFMYFLFMAAWLNFFLIVGEMAVITTLAGIVSIAIAGINIKDFFIFKKGVSLTLSDEAKSKLFDRMRRLLRSQSLLYTVLGTVVLALAANAYELLCTAGFPMVFTRILTLHNLSAMQYYLYLAFYNVIYVIPLLIIVGLFTASLGKRQLSEDQGRFLKLLSGLMMLGLGLALLIKPSLLNNVLISVIMLAAALLISLITYYLYRRVGLT